MKVKFSDDRYRMILQRIRDRKDHRPEGIHVSDLITCMNKSYYNKVHGEPDVPDDLLLLFTIGRMAQDWMTGGVDTEEPRLVEDIWLTPDCMMDDVPEEMKCTYMSSNKEVKQSWLVQMKAYCYALGVKRFGLDRMHLMGDYKQKEDKSGPNRPLLITEEYEFTQAEIDENWAWLQMRKTSLELAVTTMKPPSEWVPDWDWDNESRWQCKGCGHADYCVALR